MPRPLPVGVIGVGYFGRFHAQKYAALPDCDLVGVVDIDAARAADVAAETDSRVLEVAALLNEVEAVSLAAPTADHFALARQCLDAGVHLLLEKPMALSLEEADELIALAARRGVVLQIGHQERFFAARLRLDKVIPRPTRISCLRTGPFSGRSLDASVVTDLMIHDIDLVQSLIPAPLVKVEAEGRRSVSDFPDAAEARLTYACGTEVLLQASRDSETRRRTTRVEGRNAGQDEVLEIDFLTRRCRHLRDGQAIAEIAPTVSFDQLAAVGNPDLAQDNLAQELGSFVACVRQGGRPLVTGEDGRRALETALAIEEALAGRGGYLHQAVAS